MLLVQITSGALAAWTEPSRPGSGPACAAPPGASVLLLHSENVASDGAGEGSCCGCSDVTDANEFVLVELCEDMRRQCTAPGCRRSIIDFEHASCVVTAVNTAAVCSFCVDA